MRRARYLTIEDIVPDDFLKKPRAVVVEAGNGQGKTHSTMDYAVRLQKLRIFDRIYVLEYSQKSAENACKKIVDFGGWCIHHIGLEKFCPFYNKLKEYIKQGIPATLFCYQCPYFKNKSRRAYLHVTQELQNYTPRAIKPQVFSYGLYRDDKICTHPILRAYILDPAHEIDRKIQLLETPIIVVPGQLFLNHGVIGRWFSFSRRQRRKRKTLLIIDEADALFYSALKTEIPIINNRKEDYDLLDMFRPKTRPLPKLLDVYNNILSIIEKIHRNRNRFEKEDVDYIKQELEKADTLIRSFNRRKKQIVKYVLDNRIKTNVFRVVMTLEELQHIENLDLVLKTLESHNNKYVLYDYDYAIKLFFDTSYPWRHFWKIVLSATFPTEKLVESSYVSTNSKKVLMRVERRSSRYENVYVSTARIFDDIEGVLNRNKEIEYSIPNIIKGIRESVEAYEKNFKTKPRGICLWFGNSTQLRKFVSSLSKLGVKIRRKRKYVLFYYKGIPIFCSYCGSAISRGIDMDKYDISIIVGPLLRPPRPSGVLDIIDFSRGIAEAVQSGMRIVRSPKPKQPKLIIVEKHMATSFYAFFYPEWFKELFRSSKISLD